VPYQALTTSTPPRPEIDRRGGVDFGGALRRPVRRSELEVTTMHDSQLTSAVWRMTNLTNAERREAEDSMGRLFAQFRRRTRLPRARSPR
jgi:hypothetical protein